MGRPPRRGQPLNKGQDGGSERVRYSEVSLYTVSIVSKMADSLASSETLTRASPILWPDEQTHFLQGNKSLSFYPESVGWNSPEKSDSLLQDKLLLELNSLSDDQLIEKATTIKNLIYQLNLEEAKEVERAKCLNVFKDT